MKEDPHATVYCHREQRSVPLTYEQYKAQMLRPDSTWKCPHCGGEAEFDQEYWELRHYPPDGDSAGAENQEDQ